MEELLLCPLLALERLHVLDDEDVRRAIARPPALDGPLLQGIDQLLDEGARLDAGDRQPVLLARAQRIPDGVDQVRLPCPRRSVDQQRIVARARRLDHRSGRLDGRPVARRAHEIVQPIPHAWPGERLPRRDGARHEVLGLGDPVGIAEDGKPRRSRVETDRLGLERTQAIGIGGKRRLERVEVRWVAPQELLLEALGAEPLPRPTRDPLAERDAPGLHRLGDGGRQVGEEVLELVRRGALGRAHVAEHVPDIGDPQGCVEQRLVCDESVERSLQLADVGGRAPGQLLEDADGEAHAAFLPLGAQDGNARLVVRHAHIDDQATGQP